MSMKKLRSKRGLTLTEALAALAVFCILSIAILYGTASALRVYRKGMVAAEAQTLSATLSQGLSNELRYARNLQVGEDGTLLTFDSDKFGTGVHFQSKDGRIQAVSGSNTYDLLGEKAYTSGLGASVVISYDKDKGIFSLSLTVSNDLVEQKTDLSVRSLSASTG